MQTCFFDENKSKYKLNYDYIERQLLILLNLYILSEPYVDLDSIKAYEYADEMNYLNTFANLSERVPQETINIKIQKYFFDQYKTVNEASEHLSALKVVINFSWTTRADGNVYLKEFFDKILKYPGKENYKSIMEHFKECQLKHLKHLWIILSAKRALLLNNIDIDPFELLENIFRKPIEGSSKLETKLENNENTRISLILVCYQLIAFFINNIPKEDIEYFAEYTIKDIFNYMDTKSSNIMIPENIDQYQFTEYMSDLSEVKMENIYEIWKIILKN